MKRISREMREAGLRRLSDAAGRMSAGIRSEQNDYQEGARDLAKEVRQQERRKRINELLAREQSRLSECKSRSQQAWLAWLEQQRSKDGSGGQPNSASQANAGQGKDDEDKDGDKKGREKKDSGKGRGDRGGEAKEKRTRLVAKSEEDRLPSQPGPGEGGEREATGGGAPSGAGKARAEYRQQYQKHRREVEAALEGETIPLGQRQAVRRYFELIHPSNLPEGFGGMKREEPAGTPPNRKP
jgi:hypothetical protein